jgi:hypothetical protein
MPQLDDLERTLDDRAGVVGGDGRAVVIRLKDHDQAAGEAGPDQVDGLLAPRDGKVDDHGVDVLGGQRRPGLDGWELGDPAGAVEQRSKGETQRGVASQEHHMAEHPMGLPGEDVSDAHDCWP